MQLINDVTRFIKHIFLRRTLECLSGCLVCWLVLMMTATGTYAQAQVISHSIEEKDLFHSYIPSPVTATPCTNFTSTNLPPGSIFDSATGLFSWVPDYGSAGSYAVSFGCADDSQNPGTQQLQINVTPSTPVYVQSNSPKVTLVAASNPTSLEQTNDQKSLAVMLGVYGLSVETIEDLGAAFTAKTVGDILVVPSYMAATLASATIQQVVSFVNGGGKILLFGRSPLSEALGIEYSNLPSTINGFKDYINPDFKMTWSAGENIDLYNHLASDTIFTVDARNDNPIGIGRKVGKGRFLYVGTNFYDHFSPFGTKGHPYLFYHFMDFFKLRNLVSSGDLDVYFDPGNYDLNKVYVEDLVQKWSELGIRTVYAAAWHYWVNETTGAEWTFDYKHFLDVCHSRGIRVYAWLAVPHVSQKFWVQHPECHEKTGTGKDINEAANITWRSAINFQNTDCQKAALDFFDSTLRTYEWDGANLAEIYYEFLRLDPNWFTPMNQEVRDYWKQLRGYDPINFFDPQFVHYFNKWDEEWKAFLAYRKTLITSMHDIILARIFDDLPANETEVIVTLLDSLHSGYDGFTTDDIGVDSSAVIALMEKYDFTLEVEDPYAFWSANPFRYNDFRAIYETNFQPIASNPKRLLFDFNIHHEAHDPYYGFADPIFNFPSYKQTGLEAALTIKSLFQSSQRAALFSENTPENLDLKRVRWAIGAGARVTRMDSATYDVVAQYTSRFHSPTGFDNVILDGKVWPCWSSVDYNVILPKGAHSIKLQAGTPPPSIRLASMGGELITAEVIEGGISVSYDSTRQKAVLTIEAFEKKDSDTFHVLVDGLVYNAKIYPFYGHYHLFLPKGKHTVQIRVAHDLTAGNSQLNGATGVPTNTPIAMTFSNPVDHTTLTAATFIVQDACNNIIPGVIGYDPNSLTVSFAPRYGLDFSTAYTVTATSGIDDIFGNHLLTGSSFSFTTLASSTAFSKAMVGGQGYDSLASAYAGAATGATILARDTEFPENLILDKSISILLKGGYTADFSCKKGLPTVLNGTLSIVRGELIVDTLVIR